MKNKPYQMGMTLVEVMIALLIGAFLLAGILQIFIGSKQTYRMQEGLSRLQENGRFAMDFMTKGVRMAGFVGCASFGSVTPNVIVDPKNPNPNLAVPPTLTGGARSMLGNDNVANNWDSSACGASDACIAGSDAITFFSGGSCGGHLVGNMAVVNANIQIDANNTCGIQAYDTLIISDCSSVDIFIANNASSGGGTETIAHSNSQNTTNNLSKTYGPDAEIYGFNSVTYFLRTGASGQPALWKLDNSKVAASGSNPVEFVEGIENMQIVYGVDTDDDDDGDPSTLAPDGPANYYVSANNIAAADWHRVVSVRLSLLVRSIDDNLVGSPLDYLYNGATTTPGDRRLRRVFTSTIAIRNRLP